LSVGNLTVGGTGKTPIVVDLANRAVLAGFKPAILSRGYKRKSSDANLVVSDGKSLHASCEQAGDEPYLIATKAKGSVVIVGADRLRGAKIAVEHYDCDLIILDDGFQHVKIVRDIDMVLIDYNDEISADKVVPAGRLREPLAALNRASSVVITKVPAKPDRQRLENISDVVHKHCPRANISLARFQHRGFFKYQITAPLPAAIVSKSPGAAGNGVRTGNGSRTGNGHDQPDFKPGLAEDFSVDSSVASAVEHGSDLPTSRSIESSRNLRSRNLPAGSLASPASIESDESTLDVGEILNNGVRVGTIDLRYIRLFAFSGIARPESFYDQLKEQGLDVVHKYSFGDHHWYSKGDVQKLIAAATKCKARGLICTEKDLVKIIPFLANCSLPVYAPALETDWIGRLPIAVEELFQVERPKSLPKK
jgi:tetraacyldisaccharide-1-P 4'-kinase